MARKAGVLSSTAIAALIEGGGVAADEPVGAGPDTAGEPRPQARTDGLPGAGELPAGARERQREDRASRHARDRPRRPAPCWSAAASTSCRSWRAWRSRPTSRPMPTPRALPAGSTIFTRLITDEAHEFDRVRRGYRGPALCRGLAAYLQHRGPGREPAQPAPLQARRARLFRPCASAPARRATADRGRGRRQGVRGRAAAHRRSRRRRRGAGRLEGEAARGPDRPRRGRPLRARRLLGAHRVPLRRRGDPEP